MKVIDYLNSKGARFDVTKHRSSFTAQQMAAEEHIPGMEVAKPVVVKADGKFHMCVLPACCKINMDVLRQELGAKTLDLANESELTKLFADSELGAEAPIGSLYGLDTIIDTSLDENEYIAFQAGSHEQTVHMRIKDYKAITRPKVCRFCYHLT